MDAAAEPDYQSFLRVLAGSPTRVLAEQAAEHLARVRNAEAEKAAAAGLVKVGPKGYEHGGTAAPDVAKWGFDPAESRAVGGEWTAGGNSGRTTTATNTAADQRGVRQQRQDTADTRTAAREHAAAARQQAAQARAAARQHAAADRAQRAEVVARLAHHTSPAAKSGAAAAVAAARKRYGIPTGKRLAKLSPAQQAAAKQILSATRVLATTRAAQAKQRAALDAVTKELAAANLGPTTKAMLARRQAAAHTKLAALAEQATTAGRQLAAGRKAWHRPPPAPTRAHSHRKPKPRRHAAAHPATGHH